MSNSIACKIHCQVFRSGVRQLFQNIMKRNLDILYKDNRKQTGLRIRSASSLSHIRLFATLWNIAHQAPLVHGDSPRQEYWHGLTYPPPRDLPNPGIEPMSPALQADSLPSESPANQKTWVQFIDLSLPLKAFLLVN